MGFLYIIPLTSENQACVWCMPNRELIPQRCWIYSEEECECERRLWETQEENPHALYFRLTFHTHVAAATAWISHQSRTHQLIYAALNVERYY